MKKLLLIALASLLAFGATTSCNKDKEVFYTVTFNSEGGSAVASQRVDEGGKVKRPVDPTREGYEFVDWHKSGVQTAWNFSTDVVDGNLTLHARWAVTGDGGMSALRDLIAQAEALDGSLYTFITWDNMQIALRAAVGVSTSADPTPAAIAEAMDNLRSAMDSLVLKGSADKADLNTAIEVALEANESDYTPSGWAALQDAIANAQTVYNDPNATQQDIADALAALDDAYYNVAPDKSALQAAVNSASILPEGAYTAATWSTFSGALSSAESVLANPEATAQQIQDALDALATATNGLVQDNSTGGNTTVADKTTLNARISTSGSYNQADYTAASWANFQTALQNARQVAANPAATQVQVDAADSNLRLSIAALDHVVINDPGSTITTDKSALDSFITDTEKLNSADYTPDSWAVLQQALSNAKAVAADSTATQANIDSAYNSLQAAVNDLVHNTDSGLVRDLINQLTSMVNALPSADMIKSNPLLAATAIVPATLADQTRDTLNALLGGVDNTVVDGLNTQLNGILTALGLTSLI